MCEIRVWGRDEPLLGALRQPQGGEPGLVASRFSKSTVSPSAAQSGSSSCSRAAERPLLEAGTIGVHREHVPVAGPKRVEDDPAAVRRPVGAEVARRIVGDLARLASAPRA